MEGTRVITDCSGKTKVEQEGCTTMGCKQWLLIKKNKKRLTCYYCGHFLAQGWHFHLHSINEVKIFEIGFKCLSTDLVTLYKIALDQPLGGDVWLFSHLSTLD